MSLARNKCSSLIVWSCKIEEEKTVYTIDPDQQVNPGDQQVNLGDQVNPGDQQVNQGVDPSETAENEPPAEKDEKLGAEVFNICHLSGKRHRRQPQTFVTDKLLNLVLFSSKAGT